MSLAKTLPPGWATATIADITATSVEQRGPHGETLSYIDIGSIDRVGKRIGGTEKVNEGTAPSRARQRVARGDVLVSMTRPNLNAVALVSDDLDGALASTGFDVLRARGVLPEWLFSRVQTVSFVEDMCRDLQGVVYPAIRPRDVRRHELPIPPLREQQQITEALSSYITRLDATVLGLERVARNLKRYRVSVLKAAVEGRLVPTEAELARAEGRDYEPGPGLLERILVERRRRWEEAELAEARAANKATMDESWKARYAGPALVDVTNFAPLPNGWCWASTDAIAFVTKLAGFEYTKYVQYDPAGDLAVLKAENAGKDGFRRTDFSRVRSESVSKLSRSRVNPGDLLMVFVGAGTGQVARVPADQPYFLGPNIGMIRVESEQVRSDYVELYLRSPLGSRLTLEFSKAVAQPSLSMRAIRMIPLAIPPIAEQARIVAEVERRFSLIDQAYVVVDGNLKRCARLRQSILKWAFEGKLADQDPTDEPASALLDRIRAERAAAETTKKPATRGRPKKTAAKTS